MRPFLRDCLCKFNKRLVHKRHVSSQKTSPPSISKPTGTVNPTAVPIAKQHSRLSRLLDRSPKSLKPYVSALRTAPLSHITAFLLLHELTAVVPLFTLAGLFHYYNWLPPYFAEGAWVVAGVEKFGRYFRRKGWISGDDEESIESRAEEGQDLRDVEKDTGRNKKTSGQGLWNKGEGSVRVVVEFATAYAIVKALLIPRLLFSAWAAPWFARWTIVPLVGVFRSSRWLGGTSRKIAKAKDG